MTIRSFLRAGALLVACWITFAFAPPASAPASAQTISVEFRTALEPHGRWHRHSRWGEVWLPADRPRDWRPYTVGRWVYTDDWGWYWVSDEREARWGWVTYHYGRWVIDPELGWVWVPGNEWGPAWVSWRRGHEHVGWAPLPPDRLIVEYRDEPDVWIFVRPRDFIAPRIVTVLLPPQPVFIQRTVVVNRTVIVRDGGPVIAVNPGIAPTIIAASVGNPIRTYDVRPRVLAGTTQIQGAVEVSAADLRKQDTAAATQVAVKETDNQIKPAEKVPEPKALAANEEGRLGDNPPKAATVGQKGQKAAGTAKDQKDQTDQKAAGEQKEPTDQKAASGQKEPTDQKAASDRKNQTDQKAATDQKDQKDQKAASDPKEPKDQKAASDRKEPTDRKAASDRKDQKDQKAASDQKEQKSRAAERDRDQKPRAAERDRERQPDRKATEQRRSAPASATEGRSPAPERAAPQRQSAPSARPGGDDDAKRGGPAPGSRSEAPASRSAPAATAGQAPSGGATPPAAARSAPRSGGQAADPGSPKKKDD